ncbi:MAG: hypothetical protein ACE5QF_07645 [Thermoplasmata archaeon]
MTVLEEEKIERTIRKMPETFTVLDFIEVFKVAYSEDWTRLVERLGEYGKKKGYTVTTYLSNRLDQYSQKPGSLLRPLVRYSEDRSADYRRTTKEERERFGSPWIAVFKKAH